MRKYLFILYSKVNWSLQNEIPVQGWRGTKTQFELQGKAYLESFMHKQKLRDCLIKRAKLSKTEELCYDGNTERIILIYKGGKDEKSNKNHTRCYRRGNFLAFLCAVGVLGCQQISRRSVQKKSHDTTMSGKDN